VTADERPTNEAGWAALPEWSTNVRMNDLEALMWRGERHPEFSSIVIVVEVLDSVPDWDRFRAAHEWGTAMVRRLRQRVVEPVIPVGPPAWVDDPNFDLDYHLRRTSVPVQRGRQPRRRTGSVHPSMPPLPHGWGRGHPAVFEYAQQPRR